MIKPANVHIQLREEEATLILALIESGLINLSAFEATQVAVFFNKTPEGAKEFLNKCIKVREEFTRQLMKHEEDKKKTKLTIVGEA